MPHNYSSLHPYQSFLLGRIREKTKLSGFLEILLAELQDVLRLNQTDRRLQSALPTQSQGGMEVIGFVYQVRKRAPWTSDTQIEDLSNHLMLVFKIGRQLAIHLSETPARRAVFNSFGDLQYTTLKDIEVQSDLVLNEAFVKGKARTLWMSSVLRRTSTKPDSKTLTGANLRDALDPSIDQGYQVTAARSSLPNPDLNAVVGVSPRSSSVWIGQSASWDRCADVVRKTLKAAASAKRGEKRPLPFVAVPENNLGKIGDAYDMAVVPPQLLQDDLSLDPTDLQKLEQWSDHATFSVRDQDGPRLSAVVTLADEEIGILEVELVDRGRGRIGVKAKSDAPQLNELAKHCQTDAWLRIWFDSGHTFQGDGLYETQYRDFPFPNFQWCTFDGFDIKKEKPSPIGGKPPQFDPNRIGQSDSLFCWVWKTWAPEATNGDSWLVCDDGAMELADFIHVADRTLTLIHVKAAHSASPDRQLSVAAHEIVTSQAVKNLRWLEAKHLQGGLYATLRDKVGEAVWRNQRRSTRSTFLEEVKKLGTDYSRRVVILQPHTTCGRLTRRTDSMTKKELAQHLQLNTLLNSARVACVGVGADLHVVGEQVAVARAGR